MSDIVDRLRQRDEYDRIVVLDHLNRPYGLAKSIEHEAAEEIERLREVLRLADGAIDAAYAQAHAEHAGHSTTEAKCDAAIAAFRSAARAALKEDRND